MSDRLNSRQKTTAGQPAAPVSVMVAGTAMVAIKCISVLLLLGELGFAGTREFVSTSAEAWDSTLIFLAGLLVLCVQVSCGFAVMRGRNWGRWGYLACQGIVVGYLLLAAIGNFLPEVFILNGEGHKQKLHTLLFERMPDLVILTLLFLPVASRRYFAAQR
ncbi:YbjO family protein [Serratia sp. NPDC078593]|uniref:YbjO family protein n=1 Tax=unclassified Serratia (in: enterobacteria) TaxID=2647522 RepID=UPI0037D813DF